MEKAVSHVALQRTKKSMGVKIQYFTLGTKLIVNLLTSGWNFETRAMFRQASTYLDHTWGWLLAT